MSNEVRIRIVADDQATKKLNETAGSIKNIGNVVGASGVIQGLDRMGSSLGSAASKASNFQAKASDLEESVSKATVVFGDSSDEIMKWAENSARAFGQSRQQALEAAGTYGNLLTAFGFTTDAATEMSTSMVELAADLASFNNTSVDDALVALRSALSGETEPMKRYGVALNDARMRAELLEMGIKDLGSTLTAEQKATASYAIIMKDTSLAQGDFIRTSDGLANSQRILAAEQANSAAKMGNFLLPITKSVIGAFRELPGPVKEGSTLFATFGGDAVSLAGGLGQAALGAKALGPAVGGAAMAIKGLGAAALAGGPIILGLAVAVGAAYAASKLLGGNTLKLSADFQSLSDRTLQLALANEALEKASSSLEREGLLKVIRALEEEDRAARRVDLKVTELTAKKDDAARATGSWDQKIKDLNSDLETLTGKANAAFGALDKFKSVPTREQIELQAAISRSEAALLTYKQQLLDGTAAQGGFEAHNRKMIASLEKEIEVLKGQESVLEANRQAHIDTGKEKIAHSGAIEGLIDTEIDLGRVINQDAVPALAAQKVAAAEAAGAIDELAGRVREAHRAFRDMLAAERESMEMNIPGPPQMPAPSFPEPSFPEESTGHSGGLVTRSGLALIKKDERVLTPRQQGGMTVVYNQNAPVYGVLDFEREVQRVVRDAKLNGGFIGVL